jgi:hypothetical protein
MLTEAYSNILKENQFEYIASGENDQLGLKDNSVESEEPIGLLFKFICQTQ